VKKKFRKVVRFLKGLLFDSVCNLPLESNGCVTFQMADPHKEGGAGTVRSHNGTFFRREERTYPEGKKKNKNGGEKERIKWGWGVLLV